MNQVEFNNFNLAAIWHIDDMYWLALCHARPWEGIRQPGGFPLLRDAREAAIKRYPELPIWREMPAGHFLKIHKGE